MKLVKKLIILGMTSIVIVGCTQKTPYTNRSQMIFLSSKEELDLGEKSYKGGVGLSLGSQQVL